MFINVVLWTRQSVTHPGDAPCGYNCNMDGDLAVLEIPAAIVAQMIENAQKESPLECCGLLSGSAGFVQTMHPLLNEAASPTEFLATSGLINPMRLMRECGEELIAIYHSHPKTEAIPSSKDIERNFYGDTVHVIVSLAEATPVVRAFRLGPQSYAEVTLKSTGSVDPRRHPA